METCPNRKPEISAGLTSGLADAARGGVLTPLLAALTPHFQD